EQDFETFWQTFRNHYAFFELKQVDWDSMYKVYRPQVNRRTREKELIAIFSAMVTPLRDPHIVIAKGEKILFKSKKKSYFREEFAGVEKEFWKASASTLQKNGFDSLQGFGPVFKDEALYYVSKSSTVGYIRITRCFAKPESLFDDKKEAEDTRYMLTLFDSLMQTVQTLPMVIVDVRGNGGGHGGFELASRFCTQRTQTHFKATKIAGDYTTFSKMDSCFIEPNIGFRFLNRVTLLCNDRTASSAEDFALSLAAFPSVTLVGDHTSGLFSDMYGTDLSRGISFTLSNERYYSLQNEMLEERGVVPDFSVQHQRSDVLNGHDPVVEFACKNIQH
ncbi:MAG: S41 family peptidase, partial [Bacteroidia bacterium]